MRTLILQLFILASAPFCATAVEINKSQFGEKWPLTVPSGNVECIKGAVIFEANKKQYAVNGTASGRGHSPIEPIWKEDPQFMELVKIAAAAEKKTVKEMKVLMGPPTRIDISPIISTGLKLCGR